MTSESLKLYKLIILYFLSATKHTVSNAIISNFILENGYTDYFSIQETLASLAEDKYVEVNKTYNTSFYSITEVGRETLEYFKSQLPYDTMPQINEYIRKHHVEIANSANIHTDYEKLKRDTYQVNCSVRERDRILFGISVNVPTEEDAIRACERFKEFNGEIYGFIMKKILI